MSSCKTIARKALADFFAATEVQHAHWYQVKEATSLSSLLSIPEELLIAIEKAAGLINLGRDVFSPILMAWEALLAEYKLSNELTLFSCGGRLKMFIKVGSWSCPHPGITPESIRATKGKYRKPMLRISTLTMAFAATIVTLQLTIPTPSNNWESTSDSDNDSNTIESSSDSYMVDVGKVDAAAICSPSIDSFGK